MFKFSCHIKQVSLILCLFNIWFSTAQDNENSGLAKLDLLIASEKFNEAKQSLSQQIDSLISLKKYYEVTDYAYYIGEIESKLSNNQTAIKALEKFENRLKQLSNNPKDLRQLKLEISTFYESIGDTKTALNYNLEALEFTHLIPKANGQLFGLIQNNIAVYNSRLGNFEASLDYGKKAYRSFKSDSTTSASDFYINTNSLGASMWYASKMDSALVYFQKADSLLMRMEPTPWNKYFRHASIQNNIAGVYGTLGQTKKATEAMKKVISALSAYIKEDEPSRRINYAREFLFQGLDNYAGLYKELQDYKKTEQLLLYSFEQKKKHLNETSPEIAKSQILIGQIYAALNEFSKSQQYLDDGISYFEKIPAKYTFWLADAYRTKGNIANEQGLINEAKSWFQKSEMNYEASLGDYYDMIYLDFITDVSNFYAINGDENKALSMANTAYDYIIKNQGKQTLLEFYQTLNLAEIHLKLKNFNKAFEYSETALEILSSINTLTDNQSEKHKALAILVKSQASYLKSKEKKSIQFLLSILKDLESGIATIESQKSKLTSDESVSLLIENSGNIFDFSKQVSKEIYDLTQDPKYILKTLGLHESILYNRIRKRLNAKNVEIIGNLPEELHLKEKRLKKALDSALEDVGSPETYLKAEENWKNFLNKLEIEYPKYYKLRYASIKESLSEVQTSIPKGTTAVRYFRISDKLFVALIDANQTSLFELNISTDELKKLINTINVEATSEENLFKPIYSLYNSIWKPIENNISTENIIIIPEGELFNLSFEILTPLEVSSYSDLAKNSLLSKYNLSYNYSLLLLNGKNKKVDYSNDFIAFAPEFSAKMKDNYKIAISDSVNLDKTYLNLIPQPFSVDLANEFSKLFKGSSFINENATKQIFSQEANEHKIIHIGTHAESNNISPELSRLVFAKPSDSIFDKDDNYLYSYEIYNHNLNSDLAILTACETGKPSYKSGEGMISLAHAFNYAGSESILTSLWKIDEKSSSEIIKNFYNHLSKGIAKDKALRLAKINYISTAKGRTITPRYWAGLVLIGNTTPIELNTSSNLIFWLLGVIMIVLLIVFFKRRKT